MAREIDTETTPSLLLRIRNRNDETAWEEFLEVYSPLIYGYCRTRKLQASDAADVTQEVLLRVSKSIERFEYDRKRGLFRDWLAKLVSNEIKRHSKTARQLAISAHELDEPSAIVIWNEQYHRHLFQTALERCKSRFNEKTWLLFELSWLNRVPCEQVAVEQSIGVEKVYVARSRVLKQLRHEVYVLSEDVL